MQEVEKVDKLEQVHQVHQVHQLPYLPLVVVAAPRCRAPMKGSRRTKHGSSRRPAGEGGTVGAGGAGGAGGGARWSRCTSSLTCPWWWWRRRDTGRRWRGLDASLATRGICR